MVDIISGGGGSKFIPKKKKAFQFILFFFQLFVCNEMNSKTNSANKYLELHIPKLIISCLSCFLYFSDCLFFNAFKSMYQNFLRMFFFGFNFAYKKKKQTRVKPKTMPRKSRGGKSVETSGPPSRMSIKAVAKEESEEWPEATTDTEEWDEDKKILQKELASYEMEKYFLSKSNYHIITQNDAIAKMQQKIGQVYSVLQIHRWLCVLLLRNFHWDTTQLLEEYLYHYQTEASRLELLEQCGAVCVRHKSIGNDDNNNNNNNNNNNDNDDESSEEDTRGNSKKKKKKNKNKNSNKKNNKNGSREEEAKDNNGGRVVQPSHSIDRPNQIAKCVEASSLIKW
ncbi:NOL1/NOP2/Sun family protein [Reticulomyxa filosa]|uniref:NOL1/NOP2/Sun family protein n=1 Tax=Reticulomyxa filosa TaxID=46433 RepID=X6P4T3_RETFI|nr:NOL1/NOP2/Sun family protein [Reticulomyxa filosa]|eukprot:ETO33550.1 NOL1/NOP2/Sun family protein [Reticulomyxa filosa]